MADWLDTQGTLIAAHEGDIARFNGVFYWYGSSYANNPEGKYIAVASGVHGWAGSETVCAVADSPVGPWTRQESGSERKTWNAQVTDLLYIEESDTVMALCDQWWIPDKSDINKSRYLFLPLHFDPTTEKVTIEHVEKWNPFSQPERQRRRKS